MDNMNMNNAVENVVVAPASNSIIDDKRVQGGAIAIGVMIAAYGAYRAYKYAQKKWGSKDESKAQEAEAVEAEVVA